jgi:hypothetical protein
MTNSDTTIVEARAALARGDRASAKHLLIPVVRSATAQTNGEVWWLLGQTLDDAAQQADCLQRASALGYSPPPPPVAPAPLDLPVFPWDMASDAPAAAPPEHTYSTNPPPRKRRTAPDQPTNKVARSPSSSPYSEADIAFIVAEFGRHENRYEIIQKVMQRCDCVFADAEAMVEFVETSQSTVIAKKQLPLILVLSVAAIIGGLYLAFASFDRITDGALIVNSFSPRVYGRLGAGLVTAAGGLIGLIQGMRRLRK